MTITYKAGKRLEGLSTDTIPSNLQEGNILTETDTGRLNWIKGGWKELGRISGSAVSNLDISSLANKRYLMLLYSRTAQSASTFEELLINNDTGSNYASRASEDGGADFTRVSQGNQNFIESSGGSTLPAFAVFQGANYTTKEKLFLGDYVWQVGAGAGTAPSRGQNYFKWANTSTAINRFTLTPQSGTVTGELVVLGYDPLDTHTTNFWEELTYKDWTGTADTVTTDTFTAKKYLWIQSYVEGTSSLRAGAFRVNGDTGNNYAIRRSYNGGADGTFTSVGGALPEGGHSTTNYFMNLFVINISAQEKLFIQHIVEFATAGAGTAPLRHEMVTKWVNTSNQITTFSNYNDDSGDLTKVKTKVWGAD